MNYIKTNFKKISVLTLIVASSLARAENEIKIVPIDVTGKTINEQSYIAGDYLTDKLIRFN